MCFPGGPGAEHEQRHTGDDQQPGDGRFESGSGIELEEYVAQAVEAVKQSDTQQQNIRQGEEKGLSPRHHVGPVDGMPRYKA